MAEMPNPEFKFVTKATPEVIKLLQSVFKHATAMAERSAICECEPWDECDHGDRTAFLLWQRRATKLCCADENAILRVVHVAGTERAWSVVDRLVLDENGECHC